MDPSEAEPSRTSRKRKNAANHEERAIKRRASKACQPCRARKVRCDVLKNTSCCTNCRLDQLECVVLASRRGQSRRHRDQAERPKRYHPPQSRNTAKQVAETSHAESAHFDTSTAQEGSVGSVPACVTFDDEINSQHENHAASNDCLQRSSVIENGDLNLSPVTPYLSLPNTDQTGIESPRAHLQQPILPNFIAPMMTSVAGEDLEYLVRKGALTLPERDLQLEILRAYMFSVHPFMPLLDYRHVTSAVIRNEHDERVSLLLFQAVMFAGLNSLSPKIIQRLGFESAKQARSVFFNRVRLLYEFDVEPDVGTNLQALLLMSSWYSQQDGRRDTWYWTGQAYDVARRMGLHREPTEKLGPIKVRRFRRRLWWSLYIRDRMIALGTRRPMRIYDSDCNVVMLAQDDFDLDPFESSQEQALLPTIGEMEATASMCVELARLCILVGRVVVSQYSTQARDIPPTVMVAPRRDKNNTKELENCERGLEAWYESSDHAAQSNYNVATTSSDSHSCSDVHRAVLILTYQTTVNVLHRTQTLPRTADDATVQTSSRLKVKQSARSMTKLLQDMLRRDHLRFVGLIGVTAIIAACLSHLLDIASAASDNEDASDASKFRLYQSFEVLQAFRYVYASADAALLFLSSVSQKSGVPVPMQCSDSVGPPGSNISNGKELPVASQGTRPAYSFPSGQVIAGDWQTHHRQSSLLTPNEQESGENESQGQRIVPTMTTDLDSTQSANTLRSTYDSDSATFEMSFSSTAFWDYGGASSGLEDGVDLGLLSFNQDFYIDAFGFANP